MKVDLAPVLERLGPDFLARYQLIEPLGAGATAHVFRARQLNLDRDVVVKLVWEFGRMSEVRQARLVQEVRLAAELHHPNIVRLLDHGQERGILYLVSPFEPGDNLRDRMGRERRSPPRLVEVVLRDTLAGLASMHDAGLVHRDLKPENLLVVVGPAVRILDLGLVRDLTLSQNLTSTGALLGTPPYMSPQQAEGQPPHPTDDLYSLGVIAYEMLTGENPFLGGTIVETLMNHQQVRPPRLASDPRLPAQLAELVDDLLVKSRKARPPDAASALAALDGLDLSGSADTLEATAMRTSAVRRVVEAAAGSEDQAGSRPGVEVGGRRARGPRRARKSRKPRRRRWGGDVLVLGGLVLGGYLVGGTLGRWTGGEPVAPTTIAPEASTPVEPEAPVADLPDGFPRAANEEAARARLWTLGREGRVERGIVDPFRNPPPFLSSDPLRAGWILGHLGRAEDFMAWVIRGGRPEDLPIEDRLALRRVDALFLERAAPRPYFPFAHLEPLPPGVPPSDVPDPANGEARGWLARALQAHGEAVRECAGAAAALQGPAGPITRIDAAVSASLAAGVDLGGRGRRKLMVLHETTADRAAAQAVVGPAQARVQEFLYAAGRALRSTPDVDRARELAGVMATRLDPLVPAFYGQLATFEPQRALGGDVEDPRLEPLAVAFRSISRKAARRLGAALGRVAPLMAR
jgi:serine/threonine-protein kinase